MCKGIPRYSITYDFIERNIEHVDLGNLTEAALQVCVDKQNFVIKEKRVPKVFKRILDWRILLCTHMYDMNVFMALDF